MYEIVCITLYNILYLVIFVRAKESLPPWISAASQSRRRCQRAPPRQLLL